MSTHFLEMSCTPEAHPKPVLANNQVDIMEGIKACIIIHL